MRLNAQLGPWKKTNGTLELGNLSGVYRVVSKAWKEQGMVHYPRAGSRETITIPRPEGGRGGWKGQRQLFEEDHLTRTVAFS